MRKIYAGKTQYIGPSTTTVFHARPGKIYSIVITCDTTAVSGINFFDNTAAGGPILATWGVSAYSPLVIHFPQNTPMVFSHGLTVQTGSALRAFIITEAET